MQLLRLETQSVLSTCRPILSNEIVMMSICKLIVVENAVFFLLMALIYSRVVHNAQFLVEHSPYLPKSFKRVALCATMTGSASIDSVKDVKTTTFHLTYNA